MPKVDLREINDIIDGTLYISNNHKAFLKTIIEARKTLILDEALKCKDEKKETQTSNDVNKNAIRRRP